MERIALGSVGFVHIRIRRIFILPDSAGRASDCAVHRCNGEIVPLRRNLSCRFDCRSHGGLRHRLFSVAIAVGRVYGVGELLFRPCILGGIFRQGGGIVQPLQLLDNLHRWIHTAAIQTVHDFGRIVPYRFRNVHYCVDSFARSAFLPVRGVDMEIRRSDKDFHRQIFQYTCNPVYGDSYRFVYSGWQTRLAQ